MFQVNFKLFLNNYDVGSWVLFTLANWQLTYSDNAAISNCKAVVTANQIVLWSWPCCTHIFFTIAIILFLKIIKLKTHRGRTCSSCFMQSADLGSSGNRSTSFIAHEAPVSLTQRKQECMWVTRKKLKMQSR